MRFVTDPETTVKIQKMQERIRWGSSEIQTRGIDQTRLVLADGQSHTQEFSFSVIGDSGSGQHRGHNPQRRIAEQMFAQQAECRFILHTGDVVYLVGSSEFYPKNFIEPYRELLVGGEQYKRLNYDQMVFKLPFLPVPGNHDYYDLSLLYGAIAQMTYPFRRLMRLATPRSVGARLQLDLGWHGSQQGKAYTQAFIDPLWMVEMKGQLGQHLDQHYRAATSTGRCLQYEPGHFTRLPNRYYTFCYGGVDFFALDSNTFNEPAPLPTNSAGQEYRQLLELRRQAIETEMQELLAQVELLDPSKPDEEMQIDDMRAKLQQLEEVQIDIDKQLTADRSIVIDTEQLDWLRDRLIQSWHNPDVRGRVLFFHHPPYVTEATKWHQAQTLAVRLRLRQVLDDVKEAVEHLANDQPIVNLVLNGHAHCFEYLRTVDTGHGDANVNWIVCGGSGYSLRRQRIEGDVLTEQFRMWGDNTLVAKSHLFVGREGHGSAKRRPYSFVKIDVQAGNPVRFVIRPFVSEWFRGVWSDRALSPFGI
ncbi:metallophosphoesterase family protein [Myxacorys almedinensis]|uniref:Metallophosphoesterase n=1 Tax=Myxacorys almedinensis A TaxID=2690445 RepID=A0A8J7Z6F6_9CYAN|nr:metallophosphoesterase [Myxacorys almedinensis]NDJ16350.1 metallophosphoesterase [Myxacorys almedinensis A]